MTLLASLLALPRESPWPTYHVETDAGHGHVYCWPCAQRVMRGFDLLTRVGALTPDDREAARCLKDTGEWDVAEGCHHCGRALDQQLTAEGISMELEDLEQASDDELRREDPNAIARLLAPVAALRSRSEALVTRYLRLHARPVPSP